MIVDLKTLMSPDTTQDLDVATGRLREGIQEITLASLSEAGFFDVALFHGGTCLRILHDLDRFSEDLDFTLRARDYDFDPEPYLKVVMSELERCGFDQTRRESQQRPRMAAGISRPDGRNVPYVETACFGSGLLARKRHHKRHKHLRKLPDAQRIGIRQADHLQRSPQGVEQRSDKHCFRPGQIKFRFFLRNYLQNKKRSVSLRSQLPL